MRKVVVTGANGFIGRNLCAHLGFDADVQLEKITREDTSSSIAQKVTGADVVFHLAGENRPQDEGAFETTNVKFTAALLQAINENTRACKVLIASSAQATAVNPYGISKLKAENFATEWVKNTPHEVIIYRFPGVFGKWCRPNYNSVVATFCHNISRELPLEIRDPLYNLRLVYIDDVVSKILADSNLPVIAGKSGQEEVVPVYNITLGDLAAAIQSFKDGKNTLILPLVGMPLMKALYSTYLSYLPEDKFGYPLDLRTDNRGHLFEWIKSPVFGQVFVSTTKPGITRGNHFHHTKTEKFLVIQGEAVIRFRKIDGEEIIVYNVMGTHPTVVDIPPGYTHNITNTGESDLITLFWANEIFDTTRPDTQFLNV